MIMSIQEDDELETWIVNKRNIAHETSDAFTRSKTSMTYGA